MIIASTYSARLHMMMIMVVVVVVLVVVLMAVTYCVVPVQLEYVLYGSRTKW